MSVSGCTCIAKENILPKERRALGKDRGMGEGKPFSTSKRVSFPLTLCRSGEIGDCGRTGSAGLR
jgi:hypothetical protein